MSGPWMGIKPRVSYDAKAFKGAGGWRATWESRPCVVETPVFKTEEEAKAALGKPIKPVVLDPGEGHPAQQLAKQIADHMAKAARKAVDERGSETE
jgi:hypothetical protein